MLLKVTDSTLWYANIVNFMVVGYVPPGENKKKLIYESRRHLSDDPYKSSRNATLQHMEATMEHSECKQKSGKVVSSGQQCMKTPENLFEGVEDVRCMVA